MQFSHGNIFFTPEEAFVLLIGAAFGVFVLVVLHLNRRLKALERKLVETDPSAALAPSATTESSSSEDVTALDASTSMQTSEADAMSAEIDSAREPESDRPDPDTGSAWSPSIFAEPAPTRPAPTSMLADFAERFGQMNWPVKIGVLVLFVGLAALLRYAADQGWLSMPIELRLAGIALLGIAGLWVGWQQRIQRRVFGLSLQGGAIGILLLTLFAAFRMYALLPQSAALVLAAVMIFGGGVLAVIQRSQVLALLMMVAGFAAPLMLSGTYESPLPLFSWYAILNIAIFAVALKQHWPLLTRLGFVATFVIATLWGVLNWQPEYYWTAQFFLILFFALYFLAPIVQNAAQTKVSGDSKLDVLLVFGLPLLAFPLQIALLVENRFGIAFSALVAAIVYLFGARWLFNQSQARLLAQAFTVLAVGLATLAVPFAFSGSTVVMVWAVEGAALIWYGCMSQRRFPRIAGLLLIGLAACVWLALLVIEYQPNALLLLNTSGLGGLAIAFSAWLAAWRYQQAGAGSSRYNLLFSFGFVFWLLNGVHEIERFFSGDAAALTAVIGFCALSAAVTGLIHWRRSWTAAALATVLMLGLSALITLGPLYPDNPLLHFGWAVWPAMIVVVLVLDRLFAEAQSAWRPRISLAAHAAVTAFFIQLVWHWVWAAELSSGWVWLFAGLPLLALNGWMLTRLRPPLCLSAMPDEARAGMAQAFMLALILMLLISLPVAGEPAPLLWLPLLNPLELAQLTALLIVVAFIRSDAAAMWNESMRPAEWLPGLLIFLVISAAALRSVHHLAGVPWDGQSLFDSERAQTTITIVWTVLGVIAWVIGSRQHRVLLWRAGAVLLALVLIKLLLIDRQFLSNVAGILSFVAFGLLSILVGYLAPAPPSQANDTPSKSEPEFPKNQAGEP